jgi:hypothetical protein
LRSTRDSPISNPVLLGHTMLSFAEMLGRLEEYALTAMGLLGRRR